MHGVEYVLVHDMNGQTTLFSHILHMSRKIGQCRISLCNIDQHDHCEHILKQRLGQDKYDWLGREYKLPEILPPEPEHMELLKKAVHSVCDLDCQIGG